jgi:hypothetical protein
MFTIYRVTAGPKAGKVGCTRDLAYRLQRQGLDPADVEVVDLVSDACRARFAGDVEVAWQRY